MQRMLNKVPTLFLLTALSASAMASFLPRLHHPDNWTGFDIGVQLGQGWSKNDFTYVGPNFFNTTGTGLILGNSFNINTNGAVGGGFLGYTYQADENWTFGIEGAISATDLKTEQPSPFFAATDVYSTKINWYSTVKGKIGFIANHWHGYVAGGWGGADVRLTLNDPFDQVEASNKHWTNGWVWGAGVNYRILPCIIMGAAYEHLRLDHKQETFGCAGCGNTSTTTTPIVDGRATIQTATLRLSYLFDL